MEYVTFRHKLNIEWVEEEKGVIGTVVSPFKHQFFVFFSQKLIEHHLRISTTRAQIRMTSCMRPSKAKSE